MVKGIVDEFKIPFVFEFEISNRDDTLETSNGWFQSYDPFKFKIFVLELQFKTHRKWIRIEIDFKITRKCRNMCFELTNNEFKIQGILKWILTFEMSNFDALKWTSELTVGCFEMKAIQNK